MPTQPSYSHLKLLGQYFDHVYHMSWNIGHLTQKAWDKNTDYNETVYDREVNELLSYLRGAGDLEYLTQKSLGSTSLLNLEIILLEDDFWAIHGEKKGWITNEWTYDEQPSQFCYDQLQAWLDWKGDPAKLEVVKDDLDKIDHEILYLQDPDNYPNQMPDLEDAESVNTSVYDWLGATPASTAISTEMWQVKCLT